jgi:hypothetical protein
VRVLTIARIGLVAGAVRTAARIRGIRSYVGSPIQKEPPWQRERRAFRGVASSSLTGERLGRAPASLRRSFGLDARHPGSARGPAFEAKARPVRLSTETSESYYISFRRRGIADDGQTKP